MSQDKFPWIAAALAIIAALACFYRMNATQQQLLSAQNKLAVAVDLLDEKDQKVHDAADSLDYNDKLEKTAKYIIEALNDTFGRASDSFYSESRVLLLEVGGTSENFIVHYNARGNVYYKMLGDDGNNAQYKTQWSRDTKGRWISTEFKNGKANFQVAPGTSRGYNIIHFSNDANKDAFDVLVIVI